MSTPLRFIHWHMKMTAASSTLVALDLLAAAYAVGFAGKADSPGGLDEGGGCMGSGSGDSFCGDSFYCFPDQETGGLFQCSGGLVQPAWQGEDELDVIEDSH